MISTIIPDRPLRWNGIPLFHVGAFPEDFSGRLFFVLGQGLGDHVNGFRILHELKQRFTQAVFIVYADLRWEELVRRIEGIEIGCGTSWGSIRDRAIWPLPSLFPWLSFLWRPGSSPSR